MLTFASQLLPSFICTICVSVHIWIARKNGKGFAFLYVYINCTKINLFFPLRCVFHAAHTLSTISLLLCLYARARARVCKEESATLYRFENLTFRIVIYRKTLCMSKRKGSFSVVLVGKVSAYTTVTHRRSVDFACTSTFCMLNNKM